MSKILISTWFGGPNYGTTLQAYALYKILEDSSICGLGNVYTKNEVALLNYEVEINKGNFFEQLKKNNSFSSVLKKIKNRCVRFFLKKGITHKQTMIDNFVKNYLSLYPKTGICKKDLNKINNFDIYVTGSDQIWHPKSLDTTYLLDWIENKKKISYASCVCVDQIPNDKLTMYEYLKDFTKIMIRDNNSSKIQLEMFLNKKITTVVDPVLLLGKNIIENFNEKVDNNCDFILSYILSDNLRSRKEFLKFGKYNKIKCESIICVNENNLYQDIILRNKAIWNIDPFDFIKKIISCNVLFTDSFHAILIAVLFNKDFVVKKRENEGSQNNRIKEFLDSVGLSHRYNFSPKNLDEAKITFEEWKIANDKINIIRKKSYDELIAELL